MFSCSAYNRYLYLSPYYYHVALHRLDKDDYFNQRESHRTIKCLIDSFVVEYKRAFRNYDRIARLMHMIRVCVNDYKMRYRCKFMYNDVV